VILLIRHARAGRRGQAGPDDGARPLDRRGLAQAQALAQLTTGYPIERILSSPYVRCLQTVSPLAAALDLEVERCDALAEGASAGDARALVAGLGDVLAAVCTHGDVIAGLIGVERRARKGSVWVLEGADLRPVRYLKPPKTRP
jgi:phosphohistidine phosphatase SixA